jgi:hypothetical protein
LRVNPEDAQGFSEVYEGLPAKLVKLIENHRQRIVNDVRTINDILAKWASLDEEEKQELLANLP